MKPSLFSSGVARILAGVVAVSSMVGAVGFGPFNWGGGDPVPSATASADAVPTKQTRPSTFLADKVTDSGSAPTAARDNRGPAPDQNPKLSSTDSNRTDSNSTSNRGRGQDNGNVNNGNADKDNADKDNGDKDNGDNPGKGNDRGNNESTSTTTATPSTTISTSGEVTTAPPSTATTAPSSPTTQPPTTTTTKAPTTTTAPKPTTTTTAPKPTTTTTAPKPTTTTTAPPPPTTTTPPASGLTPSGPIVVRSSNVVLDGYHFTGSGSSDCVRIEGASNVTVKNSKFTNCHKGVYALNAADIVVTNNTFTADRSDRGRNAVQFDKVSRGRIANNTISAPVGGTKAEDHINLYKSNGTASNPIYVENNTIRGGGPSRSGSGIMLGDDGGSYQVARNNVLVNPGQVGIGIAGGQHISVLSNKVYSPARSWSNVGIYVWNQYPPACSGHTVSNNEVDWRNSAGSRNGFWDGKNCGAISMSGNNFSASLSHLD